jgi:lipoate-protein ligase A
MGLDQALAEEVALTGVPVLRLYAWRPASVSVGYFQKVEEEINLESTKKMGVDVVRRITGGGAVFHDDELTYSFILPIESDFVRKTILESYEDLSKGIILALKSLGLKAEFVPLNDIIVNGQKISGNAQTRKNGVILQHGTIILGLDVDKMFEILLVPDEKLKGKLIETVKERVTSVSLQAGRKVDFDEMADLMIKAYKKSFPLLQFEQSEVSPAEEEKACLYAKSKYSDETWIFKH